MEPELEAGGDSGCPAAPDGPEQVRIPLAVHRRMRPSAVTSSAASRLSMVQPEPADQEPPTQGEPADPDRGGVPEPG